MTAAESAEAFLIVLKRLAKWALWLLAGLAVLVVVALGWVKGKEYIDNRPHRANRYADISIGDLQKEVLYAFGPPTNYLMPPPPTLPGKAGPAFGAADKVVWDVAQEQGAKETYRDSAEWLFTQDRKRLDVTFDKPGGSVTAVACFSSSSYECPALYGIRDGSSEEDVLSHLGRPASENVDGVTKTLRYPAYNLTLYLEKRRVYMLKLSERAAL